MYFDYFLEHFREEDKKSIVTFRHQRLHKLTFGRWFHWSPWRIEKRKENEEIIFPAIFPANHHHERRQYCRTTTRAPPHVKEILLTSCTYVYGRSHGYDRPCDRSHVHSFTYSLTPLHSLSYILSLYLSFNNSLITHSPLTHHSTKQTLVDTWGDTSLIIDSHSFHSRDRENPRES